MKFVLLHAFPLDSRMWEPVATILSAQGHAVERIDLPGFGGTALPQYEPSLHEVARRIDSHVSEDCILVGVSLGGYVAMELLRQRAASPTDRGPRALALVDTKATADSAAASQGRLAMADAADEQPSSIAAVLTERLLPGLLRAAPDPAVLEKVGSWLAEADPAAVAWYQRAMAARPDSLRDLAASTMPVLVLWGEQDSLSPESEQVAMLSVLTQGTPSVVSEAGHLACLEQPSAVAKALCEWLDDAVNI